MESNPRLNSQRRFEAKTLCFKAETLALNQAAADGCFNRLLRPSRRSAAVQITRIRRNLYHSKGLATHSLNITITNPNSSYILWIEGKHYCNQNFNSLIHVHFSSVFKSKHISMLRDARSTHLSQEIGKKERSKFHLLEVAVMEIACSGAQTLQICSNNPPMKLCARNSG